jgi:hypothetical protein
MRQAPLYFETGEAQKVLQYQWGLSRQSLAVAELKSARCGETKTRPFTERLEDGTPANALKLQGQLGPIYTARWASLRHEVAHSLIDCIL